MSASVNLTEPPYTVRIVILDSTVIEAASWKLAVSIVRRHPDLVIRREHPGGGQYDVLALRNRRGCKIMLNRVGSIQVHGCADGREPQWDPVNWSDVVGGDLRRLVEGLETASGLGYVTHTPRSTPRNLVYRTISSLANLQLLSSPVDITMGTLDSSLLYSAAHAEWLSDFPEIESRVAQQSDSEADAGSGDWYEAEPRYNYWHVAGGGVRVALETTTSDAWGLTGRRLALSTAYSDLGRSMPRLLAAVLGLGTEG